MDMLLPDAKHRLRPLFKPSVCVCVEKGASLTVSSLTRSMLGAGMDVGVCTPRVVTPFWSREMLSLPFTLRLGLNIWEQ